MSHFKKLSQVLPIPLVFCDSKINIFGFQTVGKTTHFETLPWAFVQVNFNFFFYSLVLYFLYGLV